MSRYSSQALRILVEMGKQEKGRLPHKVDRFLIAVLHNHYNYSVFRRKSYCYHNECRRFLRRRFEEVPLYINDPEMWLLAKWRLKIGC